MKGPAYMKGILTTNRANKGGGEPSKKLGAKPQEIKPKTTHLKVKKPKTVTH